MIMFNKQLVKNLMACYAAGTFGSLVNSFVMYVALMIGLEAMFGVSIMTAWTLDWVYPRLVWGGVLAFVFMIPCYQSRPVVRGLVWSILPTIPHLFIVFPGQADLVNGSPMYSVGILSLVFMYIFNCFWGVTASLMLKSFNQQ